MIFFITFSIYFPCTWILGDKVSFNALVTVFLPSPLNNLTIRLLGTVRTRLRERLTGLRAKMINVLDSVFWPVLFGHYLLFFFLCVWGRG